MIWKIWNDLEDFSAQPTVGVCLTAQKFCKSEQIEQINNDEKNIWKIWKDFFADAQQPVWDLLAYRLINSSRRSRLKECASRHRNSANRNK